MQIGLTVFVLILTAVSCKESNDTSTTSECTASLCYGICSANQWSGLKNSYWKFEAYCTTDDMCACLSFCDNSKCNNYCITEKDAVRGTCSMLDCYCEGNVLDAGPDASD